ncbi:hypothetical protein PAPYR_123 [Paratrimastix pyriformis]|uniref:tRNA-intron lyase n=1 Tax=Paratrimastix pyriformis TaxID=342808 RepID=A0ABQ8UUY0_9EUKA|nr:hypothetical protein PAPYR_123 [Paratrimastix pyriformis]
MLVNDSRVVSNLRLQHHILGSEIGTILRDKQQNFNLTLPTIYPPEVALLATAHRLLPEEEKVDHLTEAIAGFHVGVSSERPQPCQFCGGTYNLSHCSLTRQLAVQANPFRYAVLHDLWEQRFLVALAGPKFGVDFVAYEDDPSLTHGRYMVMVLPPPPSGVLQWPLSTRYIASLYRLAAAVHKELVLALVYPPGPNTADPELAPCPLEALRLSYSQPGPPPQAPPPPVVAPIPIGGLTLQQPPIPQPLLRTRGGTGVVTVDPHFGSVAHPRLVVRYVRVQVQDWTRRYVDPNPVAESPALSQEPPFGGLVTMAGAPLHDTSPPRLRLHLCFDERLHHH